MALGPAGEIIRLAGDEGKKRRPQVVAALKETLAPFARADGIWGPSSTWFITATNPGWRSFIACFLDRRRFGVTSGNSAISTIGAAP